jgi:hypothetical protein
MKNFVVSQIICSVSVYKCQSFRNSITKSTGIIQTQAEKLHSHMHSTEFQNFFTVRHRVMCPDLNTYNNLLNNSLLVYHSLKSLVMKTHYTVRSINIWSNESGASATVLQLIHLFTYMLMLCLHTYLGNYNNFYE